MPAYYDQPLKQKVDLKKQKLYIHSQIPQKVNRVGVGLRYNSYNATKSFSYNFRWDQYAGKKSYKIQNCRTNSFKKSELTFKEIYVLWELRVKGQTLQVLRNNEIANSLPAIDLRHNEDNEITGDILKMEIKSFMGYGWSGSPLFYRYKPFTGRVSSISLRPTTWCMGQDKYT